MLLDINMQGLSGFDVVSRFVESGWNIPTILITASDEPELDDAARRAGTIELLRKPSSNDALLAAIEAALRSTQRTGKI